MVLHVAWGNDAFTRVTPPFDDNGFTADFAASAQLGLGRDFFGVAVASRWLTSTEDLRRWDQLDMFATAARTWPHVVAAARAGATIAGNLGGRYWQDRLHRAIGVEPTLATGLQNEYDGDKRGAFVGGARVTGDTGDAGDRWGGYAVADGQLAIGGTGVSSVAWAIGGRVTAPHVGAHVELAVTHYAVDDPNLALPGGYGAGWQLEWRAGVYGAWRGYRITYEYRANESGSGEPIGVLALDATW